jgi:acyl dehydratase
MALQTKEMKLHDLYFDDFKPGLKIESAGFTMTDADIIDIALRFDPQPFHIDVEAAKASHFGGIIASGFHTMAVTWRMLYQTGFLVSANLGGPGVDELRWVKPVHAGDTLRAIATLREAVPSKSKPDRGVIKLDVAAVNQRGETVMTAIFLIMVKRRTST